MIAVYWDESHLWGLLLVHALRSLGVAYRRLRARDIAEGALAAYPGALVLVPGGWAKQKARLLGPAGMTAIRDHVAAGGAYLGFCGGAGLGLAGGLGLCPYGRGQFSKRIQHFASGHIHVAVDRAAPLTPETLGPSALLPVWWPGRFDTSGDRAGQVRVLATYGEPGHDFMMADVCLKNLPGETLADWENLYGVDLSPSFLAGSPCIVAGEFGRGRYALSHAHLETPKSPEANAWFGHLLARLGGLDRDPKKNLVQDWDIKARPLAWLDPILLRAASLCEEIIELGREHLLLFWRTPWLLGWRRGLPGASVNSLYAMLRECLAAPETPEASRYWSKRRDDFERVLMLFYKGLRGYLLAERLAMTLSATDPGAVPEASLKQARLALFGNMPGTGGLCGRLVRDLDELLWRLAR